MLELPSGEKISRNGPVAQLVRALACHARGRGFDPHPDRHFDKIQPLLYASVAQLVEQGTENPRVVGSIPTGGTISADLAHLVERHLAKVEVAGSSPVIRSISGHDFTVVPIFIPRQNAHLRVEGSPLPCPEF